MVNHEIQFGLQRFCVEVPELLGNIWAGTRLADSGLLDPRDIAICLGGCKPDKPQGLSVPVGDKSIP
jgi:hypothetical protein